MPRQSKNLEDFLQGKIRKRGLSSSPSSTSSILQQGYRFKRAIVVGKRGGSTTPVPTWKLMNSLSARSPASGSALRGNDRHSPRYPPSQGGGGSKSKHSAVAMPVSARKLAASLWEMNEIPSPRITDESEERRMRRLRKERIMPPPHPPPPRSVRSGSLPPHLSDPSHSPVSERMDRSGIGSRHRRTSSNTHRLRLLDHGVGMMDSISNASLMETETRSRAETPTGSIVGVKTRLKDVSNALTTSKELLKIINRMWGHEDRPSSSMSLVSALHAELERSRLQVNQVIQEQRSDQNDTHYLMKRFAEERVVWKNKEQQIIEAAIESIAGELETEKKLRRRFESLNKKLGKELAETKDSLLKAVKEVETEKRARTMIEKVCDELARDFGEDRVEVEELKKESAKVCEEVEKEREMMQLSEAIREERVQMKLSEAKNHLEEKNAAVDILRNQLESFLGSKRGKEKSRISLKQANNEEIIAYWNKTLSGSHQNEESDEYGEVEEDEDDSAESDLHSIELNIDNNNKNYKWVYDEEEIKARKSTSSRTPRRSTSLLRSISDGVEYVAQNEKLEKSADGLEWGRYNNMQKQTESKAYGGEMHSYKSNKGGSKDHLLSGSRILPAKGYSSPTRVQERPPVIPASKSRLSESRGESQNARKSRW